MSSYQTLRTKQSYETCNNSLSSSSLSSNNGRRKLPRSLSLSQLHSIVSYKSGDILNLKERLMRFVETKKNFYFKFAIKKIENSLSLYYRKCAKTF